MKNLTETHIFDVYERGRFIARATRVKFPGAVNDVRMVTAWDVIREPVVMVNATGETMHYDPGSFQVHYDMNLAQVRMPNGREGIPLAVQFDPHAPLRLPPSPTHPNADLRPEKRLRLDMYKGVSVATLSAPQLLEGSTFIKTYRLSPQDTLPGKGNCGDPLLTPSDEALAIHVMGGGRTFFTANTWEPHSIESSLAQLIKIRNR